MLLTILFPDKNRIVINQQFIISMILVITKNNKIFIKIMKGASIVFHTAALARVQLSILEPIKYETNNTLGTINILKAAVEAKVKDWFTALHLQRTETQVTYH